MTTSAEIVSAVPADLKGLSSAAAAVRLRQYGENAVLRKKRVRPLLLFLGKFKNPTLIILGVVTVISFFLGERINSGIVLVMILLGALLDFINSYRSERAVEDLTGRVATHATARRDGEVRDIPMHLIVPGDVVELAAGDIVPADCRIAEARDFFVNQSPLTGESYPVEKHPRSTNASDSTAGPDARHLIFMGTSVVSGIAVAVVEQTGTRTEFGSIAERLQTPQTETSFERGLKSFSYLIVRLTFGLVALLLASSAVMGRPALESFTFALAIAIGLAPELLPMIISVALSSGSRRMAKKQVIVKNLASIENFGSMDILCTDKTGTLTEDHIILVKCLAPDGTASDQVLLHAFLASHFHTGIKSPLDDAVREHGGVDISGWRKVDEIPFDYVRRRETVVVANASETRTLIAKGAPEEVFKICTTSAQTDGIRPLDAASRLSLENQFRALSADGFRVLGVATRPVDGRDDDVYTVEDERDMTFIGFSAFLDPPKQGVKATIDALEALGVTVKIITGDNEVLAEKVCRDVDVPITGTVLGSAIDALDEKALAALAERTSVFARVSPAQKERIITALRSSGHVVGYLGDGINDAPSLNAADVGISVNNAVDVAKETADIVLLEKNLSALADGIAEGRKSFENTMKYIKMGLSSNFGNMFSMAGAAVFLPFLPMLPGQVLFNNFLYDISQVALPGDTVDAEAVRRPPQWRLGAIKRFMAVFGPVSSLFDFATFGVLYAVLHLSPAQFQTGWFMESIATQTLVIFVIRTRRMPFFLSKPGMLVSVNAVGAVVVAWGVALSPLGTMLGFAPMPLTAIAAMGGIIVAYLITAEAAKYFFYKSSWGKGM